MLLLPFLLVALANAQSPLDNGLLSDPVVHCLEDSIKITFKTEKPFRGRVFVKGLIDDKECVTNYSKNTNTTVDYSLLNGRCNMRRSRKIGTERGIEQSTVLVISFHETFITKIDKAYQCACLYKEFDKIVTHHLDVSMFPTTEIFDQARVPVCVYSVHSGSVNGPLVSYAKVGDLSVHKFECKTDMFAMLVHDCFVDDGIGKERFRLIDENGCSTDPAIISDLTYNTQNNMAFAEVNVFKFADKVTTYFQCAVSTCMISEGTCKGKTPPRCSATRRRRTILHNADSNQTETTDRSWANEMDLTANKIIVLDPEDISPNEADQNATERQILALKHLNEIRDLEIEERVCFTREVITVLGFLIIASTCSLGLVFLWRFWHKSKL